MRKGTRFLITSRDYIWRSAKRDLKLASLPVLQRSQVVIDVHELSVPERAQILYNHVKLGDQTPQFKRAVKPILPALAERADFLPETARRLGTRFFSEKLTTDEKSVVNFFAKPHRFLLETIAALSNECKAALAAVFLNGGLVRSPIDADVFLAAAGTFGVTTSATRDELEALNGSLLALMKDQEGSYWTYKHPTVSDAYSSFLAQSPELVELYLKGANPFSMLYEVVCGGIEIEGAPLTVPDSLHELFAARLMNVPDHFIKTFLSYRANSSFIRLMLEKRPTLLDGMRVFSHPIKDDSDATLLGVLSRYGLLPEAIRSNFVRSAFDGLAEEADASFLDGTSLQAVFSGDELSAVIESAQVSVISQLSIHVQRLKANWDSDYPPEDHFSELEKSVEAICNLVTPFEVDQTPMTTLHREIRKALAEMEEEYESPSSTSAPVSASTPPVTGLQILFRDVDE